MNKILMIAALCVALVGCGDDKPSDKVMKFIANQDMWMLSKSKTSICSDVGIKNIHFIDKNILPATNQYYDLSKYLYDNITYEVVGEEPSGDSVIVKVKQRIPKALIDAQFFAYPDPSASDSAYRDSLDNLKGRYDKGDLKKLDYVERTRDWIVRPDGIDPELSKDQEASCSK